MWWNNMGGGVDGWILGWIGRWGGVVFRLMWKEWGLRWGFWGFGFCEKFVEGGSVKLIVCWMWWVGEMEGYGTRLN